MSRAGKDESIVCFDMWLLVGSTAGQRFRRDRHRCGARFWRGSRLCRCGVVSFGRQCVCCMNSQRHRRALCVHIRGSGQLLCRMPFHRLFCHPFACIPIGQSKAGRPRHVIHAPVFRPPRRSGCRRETACLRPTSRQAEPGLRAGCAADRPFLSCTEF